MYQYRKDALAQDSLGRIGIGDATVFLHAFEISRFDPTACDCPSNPVLEHRVHFDGIERDRPLAPEPEWGGSPSFPQSRP
jgi:hypothetical protein